MAQGTGPLLAAGPVLQIGRPPIPHEHGAWVMLYVPLCVGFLAAGGASGWQWAALIAAATGLFLSKEAAGLLLRRRAKAGAGIWLGAYVVMAGAGILPLLATSAALPLLLLGGIAAALFAIHSALLLVPAKKRLDRSVWGEMLGAIGLSLTGPAAWAIAKGSLDSTGWILWSACALYLSGAILYVKMWLEAVKQKKVWNDGIRVDVGRNMLLFHGVLAAVLLYLAGTGGPREVYLLAAFAPALIRASWGWARISPKLPNLKLVGVSESLFAIWFGIFASLALAA
jgi:hypothetical protein